MESAHQKMLLYYWIRKGIFGKYSSIFSRHFHHLFTLSDRILSKTKIKSFFTDQVKDFILNML